MSTLKAKITKYFILFSIVPLIIASIVILKQMQESKESSVYLKQKQILNLTIEEINELTSDVENVGVFIKNKYNILGHKILANIGKLQKNISTAIVLDENGLILDFHSNEKNKLYKGYDSSYQDYYTGLKNNDAYWSNVVLSSFNSTVSISYSFKIEDNKIAVLIINLSSLNDFTKKFKSENSNYMIRIIDKSSLYLAYPEHEQYVQQRKSVFNSELYKDVLSKNLEFKQVAFNSIEDKYKIGIYAVIEKLGWKVVVQEDFDYIFKEFIEIIWSLLIFILFLILLTTYFSIKLSKSILKPLDVINDNMNQVSHGKKLKDITLTKYKELNYLINNFTLMDDKLKKRELAVEEEVRKNKIKDNQIFEQSKLASMGDMIGNIAHQWRQPLSIISTSATGIQLQKELNSLSDEKLFKACENINEQAQYLSATIDDFKNYIKGERVLENFDINSCVKSFINLIESSAKDNNIKLVLNLNEGLFIDGYRNELQQCLINIYNNAKDALEENNVSSKLFIINTYKSDDKIIITLHDNASGISDEIINNIFEPYFTTKHKNMGTGLGLHMAYNLIVDGMNGDISVYNDTLEHNDIKYTGARFVIKL